MSRVFVSAATGAAVYVFADDHCPPHVHARHRGEEWVARVRFSYADGEVGLISIAPLKNMPFQRVVNALLVDVQDQLAQCRRTWWTVRRTTCLENQWAVTSGTGNLVLHAERVPSARQIAEASYEIATGQLRVAFRNGTTLEVGTPP
jgi:hypothetical protein